MNNPRGQRYIETVVKLVSFVINMELDMILSPPSTPPLNNSNYTVSATVSYSFFFFGVLNETFPEFRILEQKGTQEHQSKSINTTLLTTFT